MDKLKDIILPYSTVILAAGATYYAYLKRDNIKYASLSAFLTLYIIVYIVTPYIISIATAEIRSIMPKCTSFTEFTNEITKDLTKHTGDLTKNYDEFSKEIENFELPSVNSIKIPTIKFGNPVSKIIKSFDPDASTEFIDAASGLLNNELNKITSGINKGLKPATNFLQKNTDVIGFITNAFSKLKDDILGDEFDFTSINKEVNNINNNVSKLEDNTSKTNENKNKLFSYPSDKFKSAFVNILLFPKQTYEWVISIFSWLVIYVYSYPFIEGALYTSSYIVPLGELNC